MTELHNECVEICKKKNGDYATDADPFKNFRASEVFGIDSNDAIIVRMSDKLMRVSNVIRNGEAKVQDESVLDTLMDLSNYALILATKWENER